MENKLLIIIIIHILLVHDHMAQIYVGNPCTTNEGATGICTIDYDCQKVLWRFRQEQIRPTLCGMTRMGPIVCCPFENFSTTTLSSLPKKRISEIQCERYKQCETFITNGEYVEVDEYPHMAAIGWPLANKTGYSWNCGGTLISRKYVITAAHCTYLGSSMLSSETPTIVKLGNINLNSDSDNQKTENIFIRSIQIHPQYKSPSKYHDIALLELNKSVMFSMSVKPACLWISSQLPTTAIATGWGVTQYRGSPSDKLQKVNLTIFDQSACRGPYPPNRRLPLSIIDQQLCAGDQNSGKDTCQGDSGGPLQIQYDDSCLQHVLGVTSLGTNCGKNIPAIYTRISSYVDWIESIVWPEQRNTE